LKTEKLKGRWAKTKSRLHMFRRWGKTEGKGFARRHHHNYLLIYITKFY